MMRWLLRVVAICAGVVLLALIAGWIWFAPLARWAMQPRQRFAAQVPPAAPDYTQPAAWTALPDRTDAADAALLSLPPIDPAQAAADVFYVHPTSYVGTNWNGPIDDARLNADTDRVATRIQASAFAGCCAVYAPRYRQAMGMAFSSPSSDGDQAIDRAYSDVEQAFLQFQVRRTRGAVTDSPRPFLLAAHSQGTMLAYRLLRQQISGRPLRSQLVAAYLIGGLITQSDVARDLPDIPICTTPQQTGCLIGWNARGPAYQTSMFEMKRSQDLGRDQEALLRDRVCVNPLSWMGSGGGVAAEHNPGALFFDTVSPAIWPGFAGAQCQDGKLVVATIGHVPRDFLSKLLDRALGVQNYHAIEYQLFFVSLHENARARVSAFLQAQAH